MNHIGDTNKMVDTPRTDAVWKTTHTMYELAGEMKRIERELNESNQRIKRLEEAGDEMHRWCSNPRIVGGDTEAADEWHKAKEAKP